MSYWRSFNVKRVQEVLSLTTLRKWQIGKVLNYLVKKNPSVFVLKSVFRRESHDSVVVEMDIILNLSSLKVNMEEVSSERIIRSRSENRVKSH